jgi:hypothetical protein
MVRDEDLLIRGGPENPHPGEAGVSYISSRRGDAHRSLPLEGLPTSS